MYVITVKFLVYPNSMDEFRRIVFVQARRSLYAETSCRRFDVLQSLEQPCEWLLFEAYDDKASFLSHLETEHFLQFDEAVQPHVRHKTVQAWQRESAA